MGDPSLFDYFYVLFPNCERELICLPRRFQDSETSLENDPFVQSVLSRSKLFFELYNLKLKGFFIPDLRVLLGRSDQESDLDPPLSKKSKLDPPLAKNSDLDPPPTQKEYGHGCIYVPMPLSGGIFVFKSISKVDKNTERILVESLNDQLEFIDKQLKSPLLVNLMLICSTQVFNSIKIKVEHKFRYVSLTFKNFHPKDKKTISDFNLEQKPVDGLKRLMEKIFENDRLVQKYEISEERFKHFGGETFSLSEHEKVLSLFKTYFPNFDTKLQMIPDINRIQDCLLYSTNQEAMFFNDDESKYLGEVKRFLDKLFPSLKSQGGLMIKNWDKKQLNEILSPKTQFKSDFEYDYLMCCKNNLIVFEIGATQNSESPETTVKNKLEQSITKIQPTLKVVANILLQQLPDDWFDSPTDKRSRIQDFIKCKLKVVVYLPNVLIEGFKTVIGKNSVKCFIETIKPSVEQTASLEQIYFVMHAKSKQLVTFKLNSNLEIEEVGNPRLVLDSGQETCEKLNAYVFALITFSTLKCNREKEITKPDRSPLDVDERYRETRNSLRSKTDSGSETNFLDIILSPQQQSILDSNEARVWIRGEPGSGKTALLLAKAILEAKKEDKLVLYCIPRSAILLKRFIEKELEKYSGTWKEHFWVFDLWNTNAYNDMRIQTRDGNDAPRALFIDEVYLYGGTYGDIFEESKFQSAEVVWIAETVVEEEKKTLAVREGFKQFCLTVLYRNSHHISETSTALINEQKGVSASTAVIHGCYTSSQKDIDVEDYSTAGQLTEKLDDMLKPKFKNDEILFVCFTTRNYLYNSDPKLSPAEEALKKYSNDCYYPQMVYHYPTTVEYAGCESKCVAIVIDEQCDEILLGILIITITRAQYEVLILVHESYKHKNTLIQQIRRRAISSQIYANVKSGSKFIWSEQLTTANIQKVVGELVYKEESGGGLNKKDWLLLVQNMPTERREDGDITFADREDLIVEIIKSSLPSKLIVETLSEFSSKKIVGLSNSELLKDICQSLSIFTTKPDLNVQQEKTGNRYSLQTLLRVIWEENRFGSTPEEFSHIEEAITVMDGNGLLKKHLEMNDSLLSQNFQQNATDKLDLVLTTLEKQNLLEKHLETNARLLSVILENTATDKLELVLTTLERYNLLERHLERNGSLLTAIIENKATDKLELMLTTLERYNLLKLHLQRNDRLLTVIIENKATDKLKLALTTLKRYNLLKLHLERNDRLLTVIIENKATDKLELMLTTLERYNLLKLHLQRNDSLLSDIIINKATDELGLALNALERYNLLEKHLKNDDKILPIAMFKMFDEYEYTVAKGKIELLLAPLKRYNLLQKFLESTSYVSQQTILQYLVGYENIKLNAFRIVFELGFPNRLLLHKNSDGEHVLHVAIHFSKSDFVKYLLDDDERRSIFISNEEDALYYDKKQSKHLNALQYAKQEYRDQSHSQFADHRRGILRYLKMLF